MKKIITPICFLLGGLLWVATSSAQFNYKKKAAPASAPTAKDTVPAAVLVAPVAAPVVSKTASVPDPNVKASKSIDTTLVGGFNANPRKSLRSNSGFSSDLNTKKTLQQRTPANYQNLRAEDALFSEFVWEEVDGREKILFIRPMMIVATKDFLLFY